MTAAPRSASIDPTCCRVHELERRFSCCLWLPDGSTRSHVPVPQSVDDRRQPFGDLSGCQAPVS